MSYKEDLSPNTMQSHRKEIGSPLLEIFWEQQMRGGRGLVKVIFDDIYTFMFFWSSVHLFNDAYTYMFF